MIKGLPGPTNPTVLVWVFALHFAIDIFIVCLFVSVCICLLVCVCICSSDSRSVCHCCEKC